MSDTTVTVLVEDFLVKEGAKDGKPWKKIGLKDANGEYYSTFDSTLGQRVIDAKGKRAQITWRPSKNPQYKDLVALEPLGDGDAAISNTSTDGTVDWDLIGLRKTRCLLWANFLQSPLAAAIATKDGTPKAGSTDVYRVGAHLISMAERDIYWREPATSEEDIPF